MTPSALPGATGSAGLAKIKPKLKKGRPPLHPQSPQNVPLFPPVPRLPTCICTHLEEKGYIQVTPSGIGETFKEDVKSRIDIAVRMRMALEEDRSDHGRKRIKMFHLKCSVSGCTDSMIRPLVCVECGFVACGGSGSNSLPSRAVNAPIGPLEWNVTNPSSNHMIGHLVATEHTFCVEIMSTTLWCAKCKDYIHHPHADKIYRDGLTTWEEERCQEDGLRTSGSYPARERASFPPGLPLDISKAHPRGCAQERGILNLGNTCYLSSVLQLLLHVPFFRTYFLADKHNPAACSRGKKRFAAGGDRAINTECLSCELDNIFVESVKESIVDGAVAAIPPHSFLYCVWRTVKDMAGYGQQDAHEFLIMALNQIHATSPIQTNISCTCIVHSIFGGQLRSVLRCSSCPKTSTVVDDMIDISLEIGAKSQIEKTLDGCLRRFIRVEKLEKRACERCGTNTQGEKQLSIKRLPLCLCIQLKRFQKDKSGGSTSKIDHHIRFPLTLDMRPYTSVHSDSNAPVGPDSLYRYHLTSVIVHSGELNTGHYTAYAISRGQWTFFDDDKLRPANVKEVLDQRAYILCYSKETLPYGVPTGPSVTASKDSKK